MIRYDDPGPRNEVGLPADAGLATLRRMQEELTLRGYSPRTRKTYLSQVAGFLRATRETPERLGPAHVRRYLRRLLEDRRVSHSYVDQHVSALKFLFAHVFGRPLDDIDVPRPKRQRKLPTVLSRREVLAILDAVENRKQRAILCLIYSAGLRVGEVVRLQHVDLDVHRRLRHRGIAVIPAINKRKRAA